MPLFVRWVPRAYAQSAHDLGLVSHNKSAMWIFDLEQPYRPSDRISRNSVLIAYDLDDTAVKNLTDRRKQIDFESDEFDGEGKHPAQVIVKNNEPGAYGIGKMRQQITNLHTITRYANKDEVAKALGKKNLEVDYKRFEPPTGWPHS